MANHPTLIFFGYAHLPEGKLRDTSQHFHDLAEKLCADLAGTAHPAEFAAGLRKLLEAKDCFVRAALPASGPFKPSAPPTQPA